MSASSPVSSSSLEHGPTGIGDLSGFAGHDTHDAGWQDNTPTVDVDAHLDPAGDDERRKKTWLAGDIAAQGFRLLLPRPVSAMYAEWGKGRGCLGAVHQLAPWGNIEVKSAIIDGVHQPERSKRRVDNAWPTWTELVHRFCALNDHLLMFEAKGYNLELRLVLSGSRVRKSYDLQALGEEVPKQRAAAREDGPQPPAPPQPPHFWCDRVEQKTKFQISLGPNQSIIRKILSWSMAPFSGRTWFQPFQDRLTAFNDLVLSRAMVTFCLGAETRIALKSPISDLEHRQRLVRREAPLAPETTLAWGRRVFNAYIRCVDRYDASGEIRFWPKRVCAKYWHGIATEKLFSPYNIVRLARHQEYLFEKKSQIYGSILGQIKSRQLLSCCLRWLIEDVLHLTYPRWLNVNGVGETILSREPTTTCHFTGIEQDGAEVICLKATYERAVKRENQANLRLINNAAIGRGTNRRACTQKISTTSYVPRTLHRHDTSAIVSHVPEQLARDVHNPLRLDYEEILDGLDIDKGIALLDKMRHAQTEKARAQGHLELGRSDEEMVITNVFEDHERQQRASTPISTDPMGFIADRKVQLTVSEELHIEARDQSPASLKERRLITKCSATENTHKFSRESVTVRGDFKTEGPGQPTLQDIKLTLELTLADDHSHEDFNKRIQNYGNILGSGDALPLLNDQVKLGRREIKLEANLTAERWSAIKARILSDNLAPEASGKGLKLGRLAELKKSLANPKNSDEEVFALGRFICQQDLPQPAIAWLAQLMGQDRFTISDKSNSDAITQLESKHKALYNSYWHARPSCANVYRTVKEGIIEADALRSEIAELQLGLQQDAYLQGEAQTLGRARCGAMLKSLQQFIHQTHHTLQVDASQMRLYLIEQGIRTPQDYLCAEVFGLEPHIDADLKRLRSADQSHFNALEQKAYRTDVARLDAVKTALQRRRKQAMVPNNAAQAKVA